MGFKPSSHNAARHLAIATEFGLGDLLDDSNTFFWDEMKLNLPCSPSFDPGMPWLYKFDSRVGKIASDIITFMDDKLVTSSLVESCWQAGRRLASRLQYLGIQDATRKKRPPSLNAQAWAGCIVNTDGENVEKTISQEK